ncbi:MAG: hypothetical protein IJ193_04840 [Bacilli bacterium]|nr:hypothetical protein [Bacilli bacterium]
MKKSYYVIAFLALIIFSGVMFFLTRFNEASLIARDGFFVSGEDMDEVLLNDNKIAKTGNINLEKITSNDTFYTNLDKIYVGEEKKTEVNTVYPMYINNGLGVVNMDTNSKLMNHKFELFDTYENFTVTGGKLYNFGDYEQADYENYILLQLSNGAYINLLPVTITTSSGPVEIPENSVINFQEEYLNYYSYIKKGKMGYHIVDGINLSDVITFGNYKYTYERLLIKLGKYEAPAKEEVIEEEPNKDDYIIVIKNEEEKEGKYVAPTVRVTSFTPNVYSAKASLSISDPSRVIVGGINFQFYVNDKVYLRKTFVSGGAIEVVGLVPNTSFKITGSYKYYNEESKKMEKTFFEQDIRTLGVDILDPIDLTFENGDIYPNKIELKEFGIASDVRSETTKGVNKAVITIGEDQYSIATGLLQEILMGRKVVYSSPAKLFANTSYNYEIQFLDAYGNKIKIRNNTGSSRTSKNRPTASVKMASSQVNQVVTQIILKNVDEVNILHYKYVIVDNMNTLIREGNLDSSKETNTIALRDLNPNTTYNIQILGTYDVEDGTGTQRDQIMGEGKFTTAPLNSLGFYRVVASTTELDSDKATISSRLDVGNTNPVLMELLNSFSVSVTDEEGVLIYAHTYKDEELDSVKLGEDFLVELKNLESVKTYNIDYAAVVKQGTVRETINVLCSFKNFKTYKRKAEVQIRNEFVTGNLIDFDVRIVDIDGAIESPRALLEVRDEAQNLIGKEYLGINQDYIELTYDHLETEKEYTFTYLVEEYNIGYSNQTYQSDHILLEKIVTTVEGVKANIELTGLQRQINGKNLFNINDYDRIRKEGNTPYKEYDIKNNTVMFGAKNGYVTHSYYSPESYLQHVTLTFKARYNKDSPNKAAVYVSIGNGNSQNFRVADLTDEYKEYTFSFYQYYYYVGFDIVETANQNKKTTVDFKDITLMLDDMSKYKEDLQDITLSYHSSGYKFTNTQMIDGNSEMPSHDGTKTIVGNTGNGYAKITNETSGATTTFSYTGSAQEFTAPDFGYYVFEAWGAQGGTYDQYIGGKGAYTSGRILINKGTKIYVYVGEKGHANWSITNTAAWNGGGASGNNQYGRSFGGGGGTDFRLVNGAWNNEESLKSRIMVAGGGGGAVSASTTEGGAGGTFVGWYGTSSDKNYSGVTSRNTGGNQINRGTSSSNNAKSGGFGYAIQSIKNGWGGGGGGGWYGGGTGNGTTGAGGSSYVSGHKGCIAYHNREAYLTSEEYIEDNQFKGNFLINMYDLRDELVNKDWYVRIYRKGTLVDTHKYDMVGLSMENIEKTYKFDKNVYYTVTVSVKVRGRYYDLASVEFTTENEIRAITTPQELVAMHTNGKYIVLNDLDFTNYNSYYSSYFYGEVDFQGHTVKKNVNNAANRIFENNRAGSLIKNIVIDYYFDNTTSKTDYEGIVRYNSGTIDNVFVNFKESNDNPNYAITLISKVNYGTIRNFVVNAEAPMSALAAAGYAVWNNQGVLRNGYVSGENIQADYQKVDRRTRKDIGGIVGWAEYNSRIEAVYSLVNVEKSNNYGTGERESAVGNIIGHHESGYFGNSYSVELSDRTNTNLLTQDPNIGYKNGLRYNKLYYASDRTYGGQYSAKISKLALYDKNFQNSVINIYDGFEVDSYVELGYFPQVKLNECMPRQEWIELPKVTGADLVDVTSVEEISNNGDSAVVKLHINNPSAEKIEKVTITNINTVNILEQKDLYGKTDLTVELKNPTVYKSLYYLDTITMKPAYGSNYEKIYEKNERAINVDLYYPIYSLEDWKKIVANPAQNYALMNDISFNNVSMTQYMVTGDFKAKLDGRGHTLSGITINSGNGLFSRVSGGTIKNLTITNYKKTNSTAYGGVVYQTNNNSTFDNVHVKDIQVYATGRIGGLIGYAAYTTIKNSSVTNFKPIIPFEADDLYVGSMAGYSDYLFVENSFVQDVNIEISNSLSTLGVGGIVGRLVNGGVSNSYATGKISCNSVNVGGLVGRNSGTIKNVWSYVDLMTNLDYVGGIVGRSDNNGVSNTLSLGAVYSSYKSNETNNIHRTTGNAFAVVQNNYAWDKQKYYGYVTGETASEVLLDTEALEEINTYVDLIGYEEVAFDFSEIENDIVPKVKNPETGELVPNQVDVKLSGELFDVLSYETDPAPSSAMLHLVIENPNQFVIDSIEFDGLDVSSARFVNNADDGTTIADMTVTPRNYFDSYILKKVNYKDSSDKVKPYDKVIRIDLQFFNNLGTYDEWTHISTTIPENYRLTGDIDFTGKTNVRIGVLFSRLEGLEKDDGTNYKIMNYKKTGITTAKTALIREITTTLKNVTFDNIDLESTQSLNYIDVIYMNYADIDKVEFNNITTKSKGSYIAPIGRNRGQNMSNVKISHNTSSGADYVAGLVAYTYTNPNNDITGEYSVITGTGRYIGGIIGDADARDGTNGFRYVGRHMNVTGKNDVGGLYGYGGASYSEIYDSTITSTGGGEYVGGIGGRMRYYSETGDIASNVTINANANYVGGLYGWVRALNNSKVIGCTINQTNTGKQRVGGAFGYTDNWFGHSNIAVVDTTITNAGDYTGGISGRMYSTGSITYAFTNNVTINGRNYVGGLAGEITTARANRILLNNSINATGNYVGGVFGRIANIHESDSNYSSVVQEILVLNSKIVGSNYVGGFVGATVSGKQVTPAMYFNIIIVADCNSTITSEPYLGVVSGQDTRLYSTTPLTTFRIYKNNRLNGVYASSLSLPNIDSSYFADQTNLGTQSYYTNLNFATARWDYGQLTNGYFPKVKNWSGGSSIAEQKNLLRPATVVQFNARRLMDAPADHKLPDMKIYSSGVDSLNLEFSEVDGYTYFEVYNGGTKVVDENINNRTYSIKADYKSEIEVVVSDGRNTKKYQVKENEYRQIASTYGKKYAYIYNGKLKGNISAPKAKFIHIYKNYALTEDLRVFDIDKEEFVDEEFDFRTSLIYTRSLYKFEYNDTEIDTYYNYSVVHKNDSDIIYDNQILVKNGTIQIIDSELDSNHNSVIIDEYAEKEYVSVLGLDGTLYDLKEQLNKPSNFSNKGIYYMTNNLSSSTSAVILVYKTGKVVIFDYRTGKEIEEEKANEDVSIFDYFKENFRPVEPLEGSSTTTSYTEGKELEKMLKETPIDTDPDGKYVLRDEETKEQIKKNGQTSGGGSITREYITYYNPVRDDYEVVDMESIFEGEDEVVTENNKIYTSNALVEYYMKESIFEEVLGNINGLYILGGILVAILGALGLFARNAKLLRISEEGYHGKEE